MCPLWSGSGTNESIARTAKLGYNVLLDNFATFERTEERLDVWREACKEAGRTYDPMHVGLSRAMNLTETQEQKEKALELRRANVTKLYSAFGSLPGVMQQPESFADPDLATEDASLIGTPDEVIARLKRLEDMGFGYVLFLIPNNSDMLRLFAKEVMPAFAD